MVFKILRRKNIEDSLVESTRQYLVGHLQRPQKLDNIDDTDIEFGISDYPDAAFEKAHSHSQTREFHYILKGMTEYMDLDTEEVLRFSTGDFYVIYPGTRYSQRVKEDTRLLFAKFPSGNDKILEAESDAILDWAKEKLRVEREDFQGPGSLKPNSLKPATTAAIVDSQNRILMIKRRDSGKWTMPGGTMELDESLESCLLREVHEETGLDVEIETVIGTYTDPATLIAYSDGEVRREFSILFLCRPKNDALSHDDESTEARWIDLKDIGALPLATSQKRRLEDVIEHLRSKRLFIR